MLVRIVRLTFAPEHLAAFHALFEATSPQIRAQPGCHHLELLRDARYPNVCATLSRWTDADALDAYRHSELFRETWRKTRTWFAAPPVAQSFSQTRTVEPKPDEVNRTEAKPDEVAR